MKLEFCLYINYLDKYIFYIFPPHTPEKPKWAIHTFLSVCGGDVFLFVSHEKTGGSNSIKLCTVQLADTDRCCHLEIFIKMAAVYMTHLPQSSISFIFSIINCHGDSVWTIIHFYSTKHCRVRRQILLWYTSCFYSCCT